MDRIDIASPAENMLLPGLLCKIKGRNLLNQAVSHPPKAPKDRCGACTSHGGIKLLDCGNGQDDHADGDQSDANDGLELYITQLVHDPDPPHTRQTNHA